MKHPFKLSKTNIVYVAIVGLFYIIVAIIRSTDFFYAIGELFGTFIVLFLFPLLLALGVWWVTGTKNKGGTTTFNVVLTIALMGQYGNFIRKVEQNRSIDEFYQSKDQLKQIMLQNDSLDLSEHFNTYSKNVSQSLDKFIEASQGSEKEAFMVLQGFVRQTDSVNTIWVKTLDEISAPRILDFSLLDNDSEFAYQLELLDDYLEQAYMYESFFANRLSDLQKKLQPLLDDGNRTAKSMLKGARKKIELQSPVFKPFIKSHQKYAEGLTQLVQILQAENGKWAEIEGEIKLENQAVQRKFDTLVVEISELETKINGLHDELIEVM